MSAEEPSFIIVLRETAIGYVFWCLFQALAPMIWFFPLNLLEISGYEAFAVFLFSPILMTIPPMKRLVMHPWTMALLRLCTVGALWSFQAPDTFSRLIILVAGCFCVMLVFTASLSSGSHYQRTLSCWGLLLGLFAFLVSRIWFTSFVPTWWDNTSNWVVIAIACVATLAKICSGDDGLAGEEVTPVVRASGFWTGLGFGSLLFLTQWVFGELSLLSRWTVQGYPDTGPAPYPWGCLVLFALSLGMVISWVPVYRDFIAGPVWCALGATGLAALYALNTWQAFAGGLFLGLYIMSVWPTMIDYLTSCSIPGTVTLGALVWLIEILFSVWTVAYNFVPGGVYTREHTDWLAMASMTFIGISLFAIQRKPEHKSKTAFVKIGKSEMPNNTLKIGFLVIMLIGVGGFVSRFPKQTFQHEPVAHPKADFTTAIWTYHFGYDNQGWPSLERSASLLKNTGADVITLLESDASKPFLGNNDLGMWLGERLGMYVDFGPSTRDHTWGNLLLSKYPIVKSHHHLLPSPHGELAPGVTATINMTGHLVDFVVTHMGNDRDVLDRKQQAKVLATELKNAENPVVFLGYVTSAPGSRDYNTLIEKGNVKDIDKDDKDRWCEYIMYRGLKRLGYGRVTHGGLSDTEVQMARFRFPEDLNKFTDNDVKEIDPKKVDEDVRFSESFGERFSGHYWGHIHHYHMDTPTYFTSKPEKTNKNKN